MFGILKNKKNISDAKVDKIEFNEELYYRIIYELKVKINDTWQKIYEIQFDRENCMNEDLYRYSGEEGLYNTGFRYLEKEKVYNVLSSKQLFQVANILKNSSKDLDVVEYYHKAIGITCDLTEIYEYNYMMEHPEQNSLSKLDSGVQTQDTKLR